MTRLSLLAGAVLALAGASTASAQTLVPNPSSDPVLTWYDATRAAVDTAKWPAAGNTQITASRAFAVAWVAADRAIASLPKDLTPAGRDAATKAALSTAVFTALVPTVPQAVGALRDARARTLQRIPASAAKALGKAAGRKAALAELKERTGDGLDVASVNAPYTPPPAALGVWRPTPPALASAVQSGQGRAKPFLIPDVATRFVAPAPPAIDSPTEIADLQEVDAVGAANSTVRTPEQTATARFWSQTSVNGFIQILRGAITGAQRQIAPRVHAVAVFNEVTVDTQIAIYASKYRYLRWRPITALRTDDGNPATPYDPSFTPFLATPAHPEYPSGHTGFAGAAETVFRALFGPKPKVPITINSSATPEAFRTYTDWTTATQENIDARVWEGIHLRSTDVTSAAFGRTVAQAALRAAAAQAR